MPGSVRQGCGRSRLRCWGEQSGAAEACWAHNPEVDGSKPSSANSSFFFPTPDSHGLSLARYSILHHQHCCAPALCPPMAMALLLPLPLLSATATFFLLCFLSSQHAQRAPQQGRWVGVEQQAEHSPQLPPPGSGCPGHTGLSPFPAGSSIPNFPATSGDLQGSAGGEEDEAGATLGNTNAIDSNSWGISLASSLCCWAHLQVQPGAGPSRDSQWAPYWLDVARWWWWWRGEGVLQGGLCEKS